MEIDKTELLENKKWNMGGGKRKQISAPENPEQTVERNAAV